MWRRTDSWFEIQFSDGSQGFVHLDTDGYHQGVFRADGTLIGDEHVEFTCINDNAPAPSWYTTPTA